MDYLVIASRNKLDGSNIIERATRESYFEDAIEKAHTYALWAETFVRYGKAYQISVHREINGFFEFVGYMYWDPFREEDYYMWVDGWNFIQVS